jgi:hypothetical protein
LSAIDGVQRACAAIPESAIARLARVSIAGVLWRSGQTQLEGFAVALAEGRVELGWPRLSSSGVGLFREEDRLPRPSPEHAAGPRLRAPYSAELPPPGRFVLR